MGLKLLTRNSASFTQKQTLEQVIYYCLDFFFSIHRLKKPSLCTEFWLHFARAGLWAFFLDAQQGSTPMSCISSVWI